jgi:hypothetical protein
MTASAALETPVFSDRLTNVLETVLQGEAPNAGRFCGYCYTPLDAQRSACPHCGRAVSERPPVEKIPVEVYEMFQRMRRRESLVVNSFAYLGLLLGVFIFIGIFYIVFTNGGNIWWYVVDIVLLFVLARALAGLLGGFVGDELGFRYARRRLAEDWQSYDAGRSP